MDLEEEIENDAGEMEVEGEEEDVEAEPVERIQRQRNGADRGRQRQRDGAQPAARARNRSPRYNPDWENKPQCRGWLEAYPPNPKRAYCSLCESDISANLDVIKTHAKSQKHERLVAEIPRDEEQMRQEEEERLRAEEELHTEAAQISIFVVLFWARYRLPFALVKPFFELLMKIFPNNRAIKIAKMGRTKFTAMTKWLASLHKEDLNNVIRTRKVTVLYDDSTDITKLKKGAIVLRFFDPATRKVKEALYSVISILDNANRTSRATADVIYQRIMQAFGNFVNIPRENVIGFCSDGCATMVGVANSVATRFRGAFDNIICIICPAHAIHLVGKNAYALLPEAIQKLPQSVYNLFRSPKRMHMLSQQQRVLRLNKSSILRAAPTRWLVLGKAIERLREQWPAISIVVNELARTILRENLVVDNAEENNAKINLRNLQTTVNDAMTRCYLGFLFEIVPLLEAFNKKMQTTSTMLPSVYDEIKNLMIEIISKLPVRNFVQNHADFTTFDYRNIGQFYLIDLNTMVIGQEVHRALGEVANAQHRENFLNICYQFYIELLEQIKERLEQEWRPYANVNCIIPANAVSPEYHNAHEGVMAEMLVLFSRLTRNEIGFDFSLATLNQDWQNLLEFDLQEELRASQTIEEFWFSIKDYTRPGTNEFLFRNLAQLAINICSLPHANAEPERVWSRDKLIKTALRNKLGLPSENASLLLNDMLRLHECYKNIFKFIPTQAMIDGVKAKSFNIPRRPRNNGGGQDLIEMLVAGALPQEQAQNGQGEGIVANEVEVQVEEEAEAEEEAEEEEEGTDSEDEWGGSDDLDVEELQREIIEFQGLEGPQNQL